MKQRYYIHLASPGVWAVTEYGSGYLWMYRTWREAIDALYPRPVPTGPDYPGSPAQAFLERNR